MNNGERETERKKNKLGAEQGRERKRARKRDQLGTEN